MFVAFEGPDGSGKTTQITLLKDVLEEMGRRVIVTREPGGCPLAESIRALVLDPANNGMDNNTEALLYAAARSEHVDKVIAPALARGDTVLCDRYLMSSLVYQGYGRQLGEQRVLEINRSAMERAMPDITFLFMLNQQQAMLRKINQRPLDRIEQESESFHERVAKGYAQQADAFPNTIVVDAGLPIDVLHRSIRDAIWELQIR